MAGGGWLGEIVVEADRLTYRGALAPTALHRHHAAQVMTGAGVALEDALGGRRSVTAAVIPPDAPHRIAAPSADVTIVYLDAQSATGRRLRAATTGGGVDSWAREATGGSAPLELVHGLDATTPPAPRHRAVTRALRLLEASHDLPKVSALAASVGISPRRLRQVFVEDIGLPPRAYLRWCRVRRAAEAIARGANLTRAAHEAGFVDGAHLNRVFRRFFGIAPSELLGAVRWRMDAAD